jgi:two-component system nitrate/nitrite response regulator NarP
MDERKDLRVLIADDHTVIRETLLYFLEQMGGFSVTVAADFQSALKVASESQLDVVLLDINMPGMDGLNSLTRLKRASEATSIVLFSGTIAPGFLSRALEIGIKGFISKNMGIRSIANAIRLVGDGDVFVPLQFSQLASAGSGQAGTGNATSDLSSFERDILSRVAIGKTNKEIGWDLQQSEMIVKMHMRNICKKLDAKNRAHAASLARELGLI